MGYGLEIRIPGVKYNTQTTGFPYRLGTQPNELTIQKNIPYMGNKIQLKSSLQPLYTKNDEVDWQILDGSTYCSIDGSTGELTIGSSTITQMVKLKAQSRSNPSIYEEKEVVLTYKELPEVLDIQYNIVVTDLLSIYNYVSDDTSYTFTAQLDPVAAGEDIVFDIIEGGEFIILNNANFDNNISTFNISFLDPGEAKNIKFRFYVYSCPDLYRDVEVSLNPKVRSILFRNVSQGPYLPDATYSFDYYTEPVLTNRTLDVSVIQGYSLVQDVSKYNENGTCGTVSFMRRNLDINQDEEIIFKLKDTVNVDVSSNLSFIFSPVGEHRINVYNNKSAYDYTDGETYEYFTWEETPEYSRELNVSVIEGSELITWNTSNVVNGSGKFNFIVPLSEYGGNVRIRISDPNNSAFYKDVEFLIKGSLGFGFQIPNMGLTYEYENTQYDVYSDTEANRQGCTYYRCRNASTNRFDLKTTVIPTAPIGYEFGETLYYQNKLGKIAWLYNPILNFPLELFVKNTYDTYKNYNTYIDSNLATDIFDINVSAKCSFKNELLNNNFEPIFYQKKEVDSYSGKISKKFQMLLFLYPTLILNDDGRTEYITQRILLNHYRLKYITMEGDVRYSYFDPYNPYVIDFFRDRNNKEIVCEESNRILITQQDNIQNVHSVNPSSINLDFSTFFSRDYCILDITHNTYIWYKGIFQSPELIELYQHLLTSEKPDLGYFVDPPYWNWRFSMSEPDRHNGGIAGGQQLYAAVISYLISDNNTVYKNVTNEKIYPGIGFLDYDFDYITENDNRIELYTPPKSLVSVDDYLEITIKGKVNGNNNLKCDVNWRIDAIPGIYKPWIDEVDYNPLESTENYLRYIEYLYYNLTNRVETPDEHTWDLYVRTYIYTFLIPYYNSFDNNDVRKLLTEQYFGLPPFKIIDQNGDPLNLIPLIVQ